MSTIAALLRESARLDSDSPLLDAQLLLCHVLGCNRSYLYTWPEKQLDESQCRAYLGLLEQRQQGVPVAHLLERQEFWSLSLKVSPATLIPRPETELLVEQALALDLPEQARVLDLGTGTGAIALALASERPEWRITAVDSQPAAVTLARENAMSLGLDRVEILQSDWFAAVTGPFELIVSNPPYIAPCDPHLSQGDLRFEPLTALVAENDGLGDLRHIISAAPAYLYAGGYLLLEHGFEQGVQARSYFAAAGYRQVMTCRDLAGKERVTGAVYG